MLNKNPKKKNTCPLSIILICALFRAHSMISLSLTVPRTKIFRYTDIVWQLSWCSRVVFAKAHLAHLHCFLIQNNHPIIEYRSRKFHYPQLNKSMASTYKNQHNWLLQANCRTQKMNRQWDRFTGARIQSIDRFWGFLVNTSFSHFQSCTELTNCVVHQRCFSTRSIGFLRSYLGTIITRPETATTEMIATEFLLQTGGNT